MSTSFHSQVFDNVFTLEGQMFGLTFTILDVQAGFQYSGALKIDLSGLAKLISRVGNLATQILAAAQNLVDGALGVLNRVDGALAKVENQILE
jgi:hypothetical protein